MTMKSFILLDEDHPMRKINALFTAVTDLWAGIKAFFSRDLPLPAIPFINPVR